MLLSLVMAAAPQAASVTLGEVLFTAGEAGFAAVSAQPWLERARDVDGVTSVFSRFDLKVTGIPLLGPATTMLLEAQFQEDGWKGRFAAGATSFGLQALGGTLMALSWLDDDAPDEGLPTSLRATSIGFRVVDTGGVVTLSGVTF
ncbi:MAG: hypothetical protein IAE78_17250 [Myxococcus sp.]|nr:hypothetical protein [Myxococcus sp.]